MNDYYVDVRGISMRAGDKIRLLDIPPPINGKPRPLEGYLFERREGGFCMMYYDEQNGEFVSNRVYWRPRESGIPRPRCKILKRQKPSYYIMVDNGKIIKRGKLTAVGALSCELHGIKPIFNFLVKIFILSP